MSGVVFIVSIPTKSEEALLKGKLKDIHPENTLEYQKSFVSESKIQQRKPRTPDIHSVDVHYEAFSTDEFIESGSLKRSHSNEMIAINLEGAEADAARISDKNRLISSTVMKKHSQKTKSYENLESIVSLEPGEDPSVIRKSWEGFKEIVSSARKNRSSKKKKTEKLDKLEISPDSPMEVVLQELLKKIKVENATWTKSHNGTSYQVTFAMDCDQRYEKLLQNFHEWGIGDREGSSVSIVPCTAFYNPSKNAEKYDSENEKEINAEKESAWNRFLSSMRARLNVAQIVEEVKKDATITFDFVCLVIVAAILAAFGLVEDSTIFLASSMLISPLMGPIIAAIFGTVIKDRKLQNLGVVNELFGIFLATFVGFVFGLIVCSIDDRYGIGEGLTKEMLSRCELHSVIVGIMTAIPSGAAVAIAILGENIGSLVGVAISASLLPPAVNSGLVWALACIYLMFEKDGTRYNSVIKTNFYSNHQATELAILGSISMCVTITNVICIYCMGLLLLKIKEVAPIVSRSHRQFWKHDLKIARDYNKTCQSEETLSFTKQLVDEITSLQPEEQEQFLYNSDVFRNPILAKPSYQNTWSPMTTRHIFPVPTADSRPTIQDFERLYITMAKPYGEGGRLSRGSLCGPTKSIIGRNWSPPKFKSISEERPLLSALQRRASMPFEVLHSPKKYSNAGNTMFKTSALEKISEVQAPSTSGESYKRGLEATGKKNELSKMARKSKKFTVTPSVDPLLL